MSNKQQVYSTKAIQEALIEHGFNLRPDGIMGPKTEKAICDFKGRNGWRRRPFIGPLTAAALGLKQSTRTPGVDRQPPWLAEMARHMYQHEVKHNKALRKWLKSDGRTLGDPAKLPWCGDCMETAIRLTLPHEPFPGKLGENPYWARHWQYFGERSPLLLGAIIVVTRGKGGHICSAVGYDPVRRRIRVRGGNQSNQICDTWVAEKRLLGYSKRHMDARKPLITGIRRPTTYNPNLPPIPIMNSQGAVISRNEA